MTDDEQRGQRDGGEGPRRRTREDVLGGISAKQEEMKRRRREKVTPEQLEQGFAERRAKRAAKREPGTVGRRVRLGVGIALVAATGVMAVSVADATGRAEVEAVAHEEQVAELRGTLAYVAPEGEAPEQLEERLAAQVADATTKAQEVAALQQEFAQLLRTAALEPSTSNGAPGPGFLASLEHRKALEPYFLETSFSVATEEAYLPNSLGLPEGTVDPRFPWFVALERGADGSDPTPTSRAAEPSASVWSLASVIPAEAGDPGRLDVTWLNQDPATGDLLSWATATYFVDEGRFGLLSVGTTTIGDRLSGVAAEGAI